MPFDCLSTVIGGEDLEKVFSQQSLTGKSHRWLFSKP